MSAGKLAAQVSHASMAWLSHVIRRSPREDVGNKYIYTVEIDKDVVEQWLNGIFTKTVCEAKSKSQLMKAVVLAEEPDAQLSAQIALARTTLLSCPPWVE